MVEEFDGAGRLDVVEDRVGTGSTDFWGISFSPSGLEHEPMDDIALDRKIGLLRACWAYFDAVAARCPLRCARALVAVGATATRSSATPSAPRARSSRSGWGCGYR